MSTIQTQEVLQRLHAGNLDATHAADLEELSAQALIQELRSLYPVVFQERQLRSKYEIGLATTVTYELALKKLAGSIFPSARVYTTFRKCLFISGYGDTISELTSAAGVRVYPTMRPTKGLVVRMGKGFKFDKMPDGWELKPLEHKATRLSEEFLKARGWRFDVLSPLGGQP
jgi:hypothetical protein